MTRPPDTREVPEGYHLAAAPETPGNGLPWRLDDTRHCRYMDGGRSCGKPSAAAVLRGTVRKSWWGYCPDHMFGRWIEDGKVMHWILEADNGSE